MLIKYSAFILPHIGDKYQQCADRFNYNETNQCFAIADGVGNSLFPSEWSQLLCDDFVKHPTSFIEEDHLQREDELIKEWEKQREVKITNLSEDEKFIFEVGLEKADFAASTFVGLSLDKSGWNCQAIGDSYLFLVDEKYNITKKVASMDGHDFDNFPEYFASKKGQNNGKVVNTAGDYNNVAYFALMTDALSDWFLEASQEKRKELLNLSNHKDYELFIDQERQKMILKDDDTTLIVLKIEHNENENLEFQSSPDRLDDINNLIKEEKTFEGMNNPKDESKVGILLMDNNKESVETFQNKEQERKEIEETLKKIKFEHPNYSPKEKTNCYMALPTKDQISNSLESGGNILDPKLVGYNTIEGVIGPECYSGGFCLVYPVSNGTSKYAFRVWHTEIEGIKDRLKKISSYLVAHPLPYFVEFEYVDDALRVLDDNGNEQTIDAVRMEWVNGKNLVSYIDSVISDPSITDSDKKQKLSNLALEFRKMVKILHREDIAHGDLQHGNIIITPDGGIKLVDYDSVYVPTFTSEEQVTSGMAAYQHPCRKNHVFPASKADDFFSEQIIYLSLLCFSEDLSLWEPIDERDEYSLLFTEADLNSIQNSKLYKRVRHLANSEIQQLLDELTQNLSYPDTQNIKSLEDALINSYLNQPLNVEIGADVIQDILGPQTHKATYKKKTVDLPDFDETAALARYSQN